MNIKNDDNNNIEECIKFLDNEINKNLDELFNLLGELNDKNKGTDCNED